MPGTGTPRTLRDAMSLQYTVDPVDALAEPLRHLYAPTDDGKFKLKVDGLDDGAEPKKALEAERELKAGLDKKLKRWEALGKSDEEIAELLKSQETAAEKAARERGDFDAVLAQH